jgi:hypothetical protein
MLRGIFAIIFLIPALSVLASPERDFDKFVNILKRDSLTRHMRIIKMECTQLMHLQGSSGKQWKNFRPMSLM